MKNSIATLLVLLLIALLPSAVPSAPSAVIGTGPEPIRVLTTTFPIYQLARNLARERPTLHVELMIPAGLGCPHDYALTPQDMRKIAQADVLLINGLGLEEFLGAPIRQANPKIKVLDSSRGLTEVLRYTADTRQPETGHNEHDHRGVNPHLFASPRMVAKLAVNIAEQLAGLDPAGAEAYRQNARDYSDRMIRLADELAALGKKLVNNRIITQHGVFDYLARDMGLVVVAVVRDHAGQEPSAAEMLKIVKIAKEKKAGAILAEPQYPDRVIRTLAREAGIAAATLDPMATGPDQAPLDYYETVMRKNMAILATTLGTK